MCLSKAYVDRDGKKELLMKEIASVNIEGKRIFLKTIFGEHKEIEANIRQIDFLKNSIFLENLTE